MSWRSAGSLEDPLTGYLAVNVAALGRYGVLTCVDNRRYAPPLARGARELGSMSVAEILPLPWTSDRHRVAPGSTLREKVSAVPTYAPKAGDTTRTWSVIDPETGGPGHRAVPAA